MKSIFILIFYILCVGCVWAANGKPETCSITCSDGSSCTASGAAVSCDCKDFRTYGNHASCSGRDGLSEINTENYLNSINNQKSE